MRPLDTLYGLRARFVLQALDAVMTARLRPAWPQGHVWGRPGFSSRYGRVQRAAVLGACHAPALFERLFRLLFRPEGVPFARLGGLRLLDWGSTRTVFLFEGVGSGGHRILKVCRATLGRRRAAIEREAGIERAEYRRLQAWHAGSGVVVPTSHVILHGPLLSRPALAHVQRYVKGPHRDVFTDVSATELEQLLAGHDALRRQFTRFAAETLAAARREGACADLVGRRNLVLVTDDTGPRVALIDVGVVEFQVKQRDSPSGWLETRRRLDLLERVLDVSASSGSAKGYS
jgi:hypothetical protein